MTGHDDLERRLPAYLASRAPTPPPGVLEALLRETAQQPQRRRGPVFATGSWLGLGTAAAAAAVIAAIVFGSGLVSFPVAPGTHATQTPTAAPSLTTIVLPVPVKDKAIAEEASTVFETRLKALGIGNFTSSIGNDMRFSFILPPSVNAADVDAVLHTAGRLEWLAWPDSAPAAQVGAAVPDGTPVLFDQSHITSVTLMTTNNSTPQVPGVEIHLDALATQALATYTASHINQPGPVALDGKILTAPIIQQAITGGDMIISGFPSVSEPGVLSAAALTAILQSGPVPSGWTMSSSGEPVPSTGGSPTLAPSATPSATGGPLGSLTFRLILSQPATSGESFGLYLQTNRASVGQTGFPFCGPGPDEIRACTSQQSFDRRFSGFAPGTILVYRFERYPTDSPGDVQVIASGTHLADGSLIAVTYPGG
jgi:SecDF, P1 head subdomain